MRPLGHKCPVGHTDTEFLGGDGHGNYAYQCLACPLQDDGYGGHTYRMFTVPRNGGQS